MMDKREDGIYRDVLAGLARDFPDINIDADLLKKQLKADPMMRLFVQPMKLHTCAHRRSRQRKAKDHGQS